MLVHVTKISEAIHYSVPDNHVAILAHKTPDIIYWQSLEFSMYS